MVTIQSGPCHLTVRGHAGSARRGEDLVCAAVSALVLALCSRVLEMEEEGLLQIRLLETAPGSAVIWCRPEPGGEGQVESAYHTAAAGFRVLNRLFPEYVRVEG